LKSSALLPDDAIPEKPLFPETVVGAIAADPVAVYAVSGQFVMFQGHNGGLVFRQDHFSVTGSICPSPFRSLVQTRA
jgi:hypothetical protein